jgi:hypothetical protein
MAVFQAVVVMGEIRFGSGEIRNDADVRDRGRLDKSLSFIAKLEKR